MTTGEPRPVPGRAYTEEQKRAVLDRLLAAWLRAGDMRLGQMLANANADFSGCDIFYIEDEGLAAKVESFVIRMQKPLARSDGGQTMS